MNYRYIGILGKIADCVGSLTKLEIPIRQKRVRLVPPDAIILSPLILLKIRIHNLSFFMSILFEIAECVGTLTKLEIPICEKRVRFVPPDTSEYNQILV